VINEENKIFPATAGIGNRQSVAEGARRATNEPYSYVYRTQGFIRYDVVSRTHVVATPYPGKERLPAFLLSILIRDDGKRYDIWQYGMGSTSGAVWKVEPFDVEQLVKKYLTGMKGENK
jgi:hypothetical protein